MKRRKDIESIVKEYLLKCRPGDWEHARRVANWVGKLGEGRADLYLLIVAAYGHDLGWCDVVPSQAKLTKQQLKLLEPEANRNSEKVIVPLLKKMNLNSDEIETVLRLVRAADKHRSSAEDEAVMVDADNLSKLNIDHMAEKYQPSDWMNMHKLWKEEFPQRIQTKKGKRLYPQLLARLKEEIIQRIDK